MKCSRDVAVAAMVVIISASFASAQIPATAYNRHPLAAPAVAGSVPTNASGATAERAPPSTGGWRSPDVRSSQTGPAQAIGVRETSTRLGAGTPLTDAAAAAGASTSSGVSHARVSSGNGTLPNDRGQVWREYDIAPYTARVTSTSRPEQAIVDWVLRETGYEAWHGETVSVLAADSRTLRVYHNPETQATVADVVERFVNSGAETHAFSVKVVSLDSPSWRAKAQRMLRPVNVQTQGVQAWLVAKEDAALLQAELRKRNDYREHSAPHLLVNNGQTAVATAVRTHNYVRGVLLSPEAFPGFQPIPGQIDEGYSLELSPLLSLDGRTIDAVVKCNLDQVEELQPVMLDVPTLVAPRQRTKVHVPQLSSFRLHERFRWPVEQVLLIGCGMVAPPVPSEQAVRLPLISTPTRVDLLIFVESRGPNGKPPAIAVAAPVTPPGPQ